jgi:DNA-binding transcriptional LysR family regulator
MDKLTSMKVFAAVARGGSFSLAARELDISKAMASKHVRHLENLLGARLFNRTNRRISLTEAGTLYRERCQQVLEDIDETERVVSEGNALPRGMLKLTAPTSFGTFHLVPALAAYKSLYPEVRVQLVLQDQAVDLVEEGLDLAVRLGRPADSTLIARPLASARLMVCGAPAYLESHGVPETLEDLADHSCLIYTQWVPRGAWRFKNRHGEFSVPVSGSFQATTGDALRIAAIHGCGLVQLATYVVGPDLKAGTLRAVLGTYEPDPLPIHALYPHRRHLSATVRTFVEFLHARFQPKPYWEVE